MMNTATADARVVLANYRIQDAFPAQCKLVDQLDLLFQRMQTEVQEGAALGDFLSRYATIDSAPVQAIEKCMGVDALHITPEILHQSPIYEMVRVLALTSQRPSYGHDQAKRMLEVLMRPVPVLKAHISGGWHKECDPTLLMSALAYSLLREARYVASRSQMGIVNRDRCDFMASIVLSCVRDRVISIHSGNWREIAFMVAGIHY